VILTDTHCHLYFEAYRNDLPDVIHRAVDQGVFRVLVPGIDLQTSRQAVELAEQFPMVYAAVGVHPNSAETWTQGTTAELRRLAAHPKVAAIGEIGLDYYREQAPSGKQQEVLERQLTLASSLGLPVVLHFRNTSEQERACIEDLLDLLAGWVEQAAKQSPELKHRCGVLHSFSGNLQESQQARELGFFIGITGPITFKNAESLRAVVRACPQERLLVETDGPFLTPQPHRGKRNEPAYVRFVVEQMAQVTRRPEAELAAQTAKNAQRLFHWSEPL